MPRYRQPSQSANGQESSGGQSRVRVSTPHRRASVQNTVSTPQTPTNPAHKPLWKNPLTWVLVCIAAGILVIPKFIEDLVPKVIAIHASDVSDSGIAHPELPLQVCKSRAENLKTGDLAIDLQFSDRAEAISDKLIRQDTDLNGLCAAITTMKNRPNTISRKQGTSPIAIIDRITNAVVTQRRKNNQNPVVVTLWLDEAEPVPGQSAYDYDHFQKQVEKITNDRSKVAIIGTKGELREELEKRLGQNSSVFLCTENDGKECVSRVFEAARSLPQPK